MGKRLTKKDKQQNRNSLKANHWTTTTLEPAPNRRAPSSSAKATFVHREIVRSLAGHKRKSFKHLDDTKNRIRCKKPSHPDLWVSQRHPSTAAAFPSPPRQCPAASEWRQQLRCRPPEPLRQQTSKGTAASFLLLKKRMISKYICISMLLGSALKCEVLFRFGLVWAYLGLHLWTLFGLYLGFGWSILIVFKVWESICALMPAKQSQRDGLFFHVGPCCIHSILYINCIYIYIHMYSVIPWYHLWRKPKMSSNMRDTHFGWGTLQRRTKSCKLRCKHVGPTCGSLKNHSSSTSKCKSLVRTMTLWWSQNHYTHHHLKNHAIQSDSTFERMCRTMTSVVQKPLVNYPMVVCLLCILFELPSRLYRNTSVHKQPILQSYRSSWVFCWALQTLFINVQTNTLFSPRTW